MSITDETKRLLECLRALRAIADDGLPCRECGFPHAQRIVLDKTTWADPVDGHPYRPYSVKEFARDVLNGPPRLPTEVWAVAGESGSLFLRDGRPGWTQSSGERWFRTTVTSWQEVLP